MNSVRQIAFAWALVTVMARPAAARPDLAAPRPLGGLTVYADDRVRGLFYYGPGDLAVVRDGDGRPDVHFVQVRYTGSVATGDRGRTLHRSLLSFRVAMQAPGAAELQAARRAVAGAGGAIELRPLPIRRLEAALVYAPVGAEETATALPAGHFEEAETDAPRTAGEFWTTRSYTLGLDPATSELFAGALTKGQVVLSLSYAFYATGGAPTSPEKLVGSPAAVSALKKVLAARPAGDAGSEPAQESGEQLVRAGALSIEVDAKRWPGFLQRVDINERVPPGYPLLDVYCYDFRDSLRQALYEKQVEIEAEGMGGRPVVASVRFGRDQPELYARSIRFGLAVRLDRPYRYRVRKFAEDGTSAVTPWRRRESWTELLDVTTPQEPAAEGEDRPGDQT